VVNTHLGLSRPDRTAQVEELLGPRWLGDPRCRDPIILLGDFNAPPRTRAYRRLARELRDAQLAAGHQRPRATFPAYLPVLPLDHVFVSPSVEVLGAEVVRTELTRVASDHLPLSVDIRLRPADGTGEGT
jgi:endonuclease/exonuclease/phosphatase family metal-dependent hydrolase